MSPKSRRPKSLGAISLGRPNPEPLPATELPRQAGSASGAASHVLVGQAAPCSLRGRLRQRAAVHVLVGQAAPCSLRGRLRQRAAVHVLPIGSSLPNYDTTSSTGNRTTNNTHNNTRNRLSISVFRGSSNTGYNTHYDTGNDMESRTPL